jgi:hypothetical protein
MAFGGGTDAFIAKLNPSLKTLDQATYLGGSAVINVANAIALDASGDVYVAGNTQSTNFPGTAGGAQSSGIEFVAKVSGDLSGSAPPPPVAPTASNGSLTAIQDVVTSGTLVAAPGVSGDTLTYDVVAQAGHGSVSITNSATGAYTYTSSASYSGSDSFTFAAVDNQYGLVSNTATITIAVNASGPPAANSSTVVSEVGQPVSAVMSAAPTTGRQIASFQIVAPPSHGTAVLTNGVSSGVFLYTPTAGYTGNDSFAFTATDDLGHVSNVAILTIVQDTLPTANNVTATTLPGQLVTDSFSAAPGTPGQTLTYQIVTQPTHGTVVITNASTGAFTYTPNPGYSGADSFTFKVTDNVGGTSNVATVTVNVQGNTSSSGGGALDWLSLLVFGLIGIRRHIRRG